jgi:hypothetical protein
VWFGGSLGKQNIVRRARGLPPRFDFVCKEQEKIADTEKPKKTLFLFQHRRLFHSLPLSRPSLPLEKQKRTSQKSHSMDKKTKSCTPLSLSFFLSLSLPLR